MMKSLSKLALEYANRTYPFQMFEDKEGVGEARYFARNPDLEGCMAQGRTQSEAIQNLKDARIDYIEFLFERGLPVPEPSVLPAPGIPTEASGISNLKVTISQGKQTIDDALENRLMSKVIEKDSCELLYEASLEISVVSHSDDYSEKQ